MLLYWFTGVHEHILAWMKLPTVLSHNELQINAITHHIWDLKGRLSGNWIHNEGFKREAGEPVKWWTGTPRNDVNNISIVLNFAPFWPSVLFYMGISVCNLLSSGRCLPSLKSLSYSVTKIIYVSELVEMSLIICQWLPRDYHWHVIIDAYNT